MLMKQCLVPAQCNNCIWRHVSESYVY